jgi:nicotinamidase-related amidase
LGRPTSREWTNLPTSIGREQGIAMSYDPSTTAILLVDPYNDFLSDGGKLWARVKAVAEEVKLLDHLREVVSIARARGLKIFFVPHHR